MDKRQLEQLENREMFEDLNMLAKQANLVIRMQLKFQKEELIQ